MWRTLLAVTAAAVILASPTDAESCSCVVFGNRCEQLIKSDAIFEATVAAITPEQSTNQPEPFSRRRVVHLVDVRPLRGEVPRSVLIDGSGSSCAYEFEIGRRYFIDGSRLPDGRLSTSPCALTRPIDAASELTRYAESLNGTDTRGTLFGRVYIPTWDSSPNTPIGSARVTIEGLPEFSVVTGPTGYFTMTGLPPGKHRATVRLPAPYNTVGGVKPEAFTFEHPNACAEVSLAVEISGSISGTVVDEKGMPLEDVIVTIASPELLLQPATAGWFDVTTDESGKYVATNIPPGKYIASINPLLGPMRRNPYRAAHWRSSNGAFEFGVGLGERLTLAPITTSRLEPVQVVGQVIGLDGKPFIGVTVEAGQITEYPRVFFGDSARTNADGRFTMELWRGVRFRIVVGERNAPLATQDIVAGEGPVTIIVLPR